MANKVRNNNVTVNTNTAKVEEKQAPVVEQEKAPAEETKQEQQPEETQENPAPVEGQEQLPAAVPEVKKGFFRRKTKEEKEAARAEKLAKIDALRADGHRFKAAIADVGIVVGDAAVKTAKVVGIGAVVVGGVAGAVALANAKKEKEESGDNLDESEDNIIDDHVDDTNNEVTSEESEATES